MFDEPDLSAEEAVLLAGIELSAAQGFELSATAASGEPVAFGVDDPFQIFVPEWLFAPTGGTLFEVFFFDPADQATPALTDGFGAVFTNVTSTLDTFVESNLDLENGGFASMLFKDAPGGVLEQLDILPGDHGGLAFGGIAFEAPLLASVQILAGAIAID